MSREEQRGCYRPVFAWSLDDDGAEVWTARIDGANWIAAEGASLPEAAQALGSAARAYAQSWHERLHEAPEHAQHAVLVELIDAQLWAWLLPAAIKATPTFEPRRSSPTVTEGLDLRGVRRVAVAGDWHGVDGAARQVIERAAEQGVHLLVHVGDFGIGPWGNSDRSMTKLVDAALHKHGSRLLVVPGNHENYDRLDAAKRDREGMLVLGKRLRALPRGHRWSVGTRRFGAIGGAVSVDRRHRAPGVSWWPQEAPMQADVDTLSDEPLDVLVTHDVPEGGALVKSGFPVREPELSEANEVRALLRQAVDRTKPHLVFCGHWHQRRSGVITHPDGSQTTTHVLDMEWTHGNAVVLDLDTLDVQPLITQSP